MSVTKPLNPRSLRSTVKIQDIKQIPRENCFASQSHSPLIAEREWGQRLNYIILKSHPQGNVERVLMGKVGELIKEMETVKIPADSLRNETGNAVSYAEVWGKYRTQG